MKYFFIILICIKFLFAFNIKGLFDSWDINKTINNRQISTKIDNKEFNLTVVSLNEDNNSLQLDRIGDINVSIFDVTNNKRISNIVVFNTNISPEINATFKVSYASSNAKVGFLICSNYNPDDNSHTLYNYSHCQGDIVNCNVSGLHFRRCYSSDSFAIRPYKFKIFSLPSVISGKNFKLKVEALDFEGKPALNYNESVKIKGSSPDIEYNDANISKGCITGKLEGTNLKFANGVANLDLNYSEVGDLNITIKEINGSEFAKIDKDDTSWINRQILSDSIILEVIPDHFDIIASYYNFNKNSFTYISNDLNMSSILDINISAKNANNKVTKNYNSQCYAKNFDLNISYTNIPKNIKNILFKEKDSKEINTSSLNIITENFSKDFFKPDDNGSAKLTFYINFEKNYTTPVNEFNFTIRDINISDEDTFGYIDLNKSANFLYGRIDLKNISGYGNILNSIVKYEYWDDNKGWIVNKEHNSSIYGDINLTLSYYPNLKIQLGDIVNGEQNLTISTTHALPYSTKVHIAIPSWLWYHPLAKQYKNPKTSSGLNLDCLTHPCFSVSFQKNSQGWGGIEGTSNVKYSEENRTVKSNSNIIINKKDSFIKINW